MKSYYINLKHRKDRRSHIDENIKSLDFFKDLQRIEAIYKKRGAIGATMSHIKALEKFNGKEDMVLIMEDDFFIFDKQNFLDFVKDFEEIKNSDIWDAIVLTPRGDTVEKNVKNNFNRIKNNQTATAYILKKELVPILIKNFSESKEALERRQNPDIWALDQHWKVLQEKYKFLYYDKLFAGQMPCYSDIERKKVDYNDRFKKQNNY